MSTELMTKSEMAQMLETLPASCVMDAIEKIKPSVSTGKARMVLLNLEEQHLVLWERGIPRIDLTSRGRRFLEALKKEQS